MESEWGFEPHWKNKETLANEGLKAGGRGFEPLSADPEEPPSQSIASILVSDHHIWW
jgi:hypothetical protein